MRGRRPSTAAAVAVTAAAVAAVATTAAVAPLTVVMGLMGSQSLKCPTTPSPLTAHFQWLEPRASSRSINVIECCCRSPAAASGAAAPSGAATGEEKAVVSSAAPAPPAAAPAAPLPRPPLPSPSSSAMLEEASPAAAARLSLLLLLLLLLRAWAAMAAECSTPISPPDVSPSWRCAHAHNISESDGRFCTSSKRRKWRRGWSFCRWVGSSYPSSRSVRAIASGDASSLQPDSWCTCSSTSWSHVTRAWSGRRACTGPAPRRQGRVLSRSSSSYSAECSKAIQNAVAGCILTHTSSSCFRPAALGVTRAPPRP
jgi:hypothetical protein